MEILLEKIKSREAVVGVIGLGYVGLPLLMEFSKAGFQMIGFDVDPEKTGKLNNGESYIHHIDSTRVKELVDSGSFTATNDFSRLKEVDCITICVPTPLNKYREPDLSYVERTGETIAEYFKKETLIVLESTTYPGTSDELLKPILESGGFICGEDFYLAYSPEREDPGNPKFSTSTIPKVVGGITPSCAELARELYDSIVVSVITLSSTKAAEMTKLLENIYRCVNIALVNELKMLTDKMGIDLWEVIDAASTKPFGFQPFYPGPGLGGHCIPIDPFYLTWKAREFDMSTNFIELAGEVNTKMPEYVVHKTMEILNEHQKSLKGSRVLILGAAYKKDVDDIRESPAIKLIELLISKGAIVEYNDPYIPRFPSLRSSKLRLKSIHLDEEALQSFDCTIIVTDHTKYDYQWIVDNSNIIIDTRNGTKNVTENRHKIYKA